jgi:hypothetical protein
MHATGVFNNFRLTNTNLHDLDDGAHGGGGRALCVVSAGGDAVEELAALADLHDEVDGVSVLERLAQVHDVRVRWHGAHDGYLPAHVLHVNAAAQLALADGLARQQLAGRRVRAPPRYAELAAPQLLAEFVPPAQLLGGGSGSQAISQHGDRGPPDVGGAGDGGERGAGPHVRAAEAATAVSAAAGPPLAGRRPGHAAVTHRRSAALRRRRRAGRCSGRPDGADDLSLPLPLSRAGEGERDGGEWRSGAWLNMRHGRSSSFLPDPSL